MNDVDAVDDNELIYRRVPVVWYDADRSALDEQAFHPNAKRDHDGLSVTRAKHTTPAQAASNQWGKKFYIAEFRAGDLREIGILIEPAPTDDDPGHSLLTNMNSEKRHETECKDREYLLARKLCLNVYGPLPDDGPE